MSDEPLYLVDPDAPGADERSAPPPRPRRRSFVGSGRFFGAFVAAGALAGLLAFVLVSEAAGDQAPVWTERAITWPFMLFGILGALGGAVVAVVVEAFVRAMRSVRSVRGGGERVRATRGGASPRE